MEDNTENPAQSGTSIFSDQEQKIVTYVRKNGHCTTAAITEILEVKERRARSLLGSLVQKSVLTKEGSARNTRYIAGMQFPEEG